MYGRHSRAQIYTWVYMRIGEVISMAFYTSRERWTILKKQKGDNELSIWRKAKVSARVVYAVPR